jgi:ABC-type cobalamin/Fe3+-siderophores transport system ATPase subunit
MTAMFEAKTLVAQRPGGPAVGPLNLTLRAGDWVALVGPNGGGKSTLLRALLGLDAPHAGTVRYAGAELPSGRARLELITALLQEEARSALTVRELVSLGFGQPHSLASAERARVDVVLERLRLHHLATVPTTRLSGGEWQRTRIARALVPAPRMLVLDEPTNHLDPEARARVLSVLREEVRAGALLCATHDAALAAACQRVLHVDHGVNPLERSRADAAFSLAEAP